MKDVRKNFLEHPKVFVPPRKLFVGPKVFFQSFLRGFRVLGLVRARSGPVGLRVCGRPVGPCDVRMSKNDTPLWRETYSKVKMLKN